jgi:hypothetical protein
MVSGKSLRDQILSADDIQKERVSVPQWGFDVWVKALTGTERDAWENSIITQQGKNTNVSLINLRAKLLVMCIVDEDGKRIFADNEAETLGKKSASALNLLFETAQRLNALTEADEAELGKGLPLDQSGGSGSD